MTIALCSVDRPQDSGWGRFPTGLWEERLTYPRHIWQLCLQQQNWRRFTEQCEQDKQSIQLFKLQKHKLNNYSCLAKSCNKHRGHKIIKNRAARKSHICWLWVKNTAGEVTSTYWVCLEEQHKIGDWHSFCSGIHSSHAWLHRSSFQGCSQLPRARGHSQDRRNTCGFPARHCEGLIHIPEPDLTWWKIKLLMLWYWYATKHAWIDSIDGTNLEGIECSPRSRNGSV